VAPEVSELSYGVGAVTLQGFQIPSVITRRAESTLELKSGQTFAMAGLISRSINGTSSNVPLLGDLPVLGGLFRSTRYQTGETELVVLVTASLVEPLSLASPPPVPGVTDVPPNDWDFYIWGRVRGQGPAKVSPAEAAYLKKLGFDQLKGPGSWETYEQGAAPSGATQRPMPSADTSK
jgi:pilus assembly protein CpaC